jgi:hypothetical protein
MGCGELAGNEILGFGVWGGFVDARNRVGEVRGRLGQ